MTVIRVDGMSLAILKDRELEESVDYVVVAHLYAPDPRFQSRHMLVGESHGLFRINKATLEHEVLFAIERDPDNKCVFKALHKVKKQFQSDGTWPTATQWAAG